MSGQSWTPALKPGLIPLHPLTFGALLGKPFAALRHNPKVLFGFAIVIQLVVAMITLVVVGAMVYLTFLRMESVSPASEDFYPILWGSIALNGLVVLVMGFVSVAFTAVMQGVVAANIAYAALGEKAVLGRLWRLVRPAFWRLVGWSLLQGAVAIIAVLILGAIVFGGVMAGAAESGGGVALFVVLGILLMLGMLVTWIWLSTKLLLVPSILVLERAAIRGAIVRSWRLTRGRFWTVFAVILLVNVIMNIAVSIVSVPLSLLSSMFGSVIAPTGPTDTASMVTFAVATIAPQLLTYVLQAIAIVVQCAAAAFIYLDCRMRYEGLDHTLISHLERRDRGVSEDDLGDPFAVDPARAVSSAPPPAVVPSYAMAPVGGVMYPPAYPQQAYPGQQGFPQQQPYSAQPGYPPQQGYPAQQPYPGQQAPVVAPQEQRLAPAPPAPHAPPSTDTVWAPPGSGTA